MPDTPLTRERILEAAEEVLRRYSPAKATVVDMARVLGVSHGSVYRHFPSKAALVDAVVERWLHALVEPLEAVAGASGPAEARLVRWLDLLVASKHARAREDPELFATYVALTAETRDVVHAHVGTLLGQLARIIADGAAQGTFATEEPASLAQAVFVATSRFHDPVNAASWSGPDEEPAYAAVRAFVLAGLRR